MKLNKGRIYQIRCADYLITFQIVEFNKQEGDLIQVFLNEIDIEKANDGEYVLTEKDFFFTRIPLNAALKKGFISSNISIKGNSNLKIEVPKFFRAKHNIKGEHIGWHIIEAETGKYNFTKELDEKQKLLSPYGTINDTTLIEWTKSNWHPLKWN